MPKCTLRNMGLLFAQGFCSLASWLLLCAFQTGCRQSNSGLSDVQAEAQAEAYTESLAARDSDIAGLRSADVEQHQAIKALEVR